MTGHSILLRILIVDDEPLARERARRLLDRAGGNIVIGEAQNAVEAMEQIEENQPDVLLLDINMPDVDGVRMLEALDDPPAVIFSTAHDHHAVRAFELDAVDYLLKPYSAERLSKALDKVRRQFASDASQEPAGVRISADDGLETRLLATEEISAAQIEEGVVFLQLGSGERLTYAKSLNELEDDLAGHGFFRASRQGIIRLLAIERVGPGDNGGLTVSLEGGIRHSVSRRRSRHLKSRLGLS